MGTADEDLQVIVDYDPSGVNAPLYTIQICAHLPAIDRVGWLKLKNLGRSASDADFRAALVREHGEAAGRLWDACPALDTAFPHRGLPRHPLQLRWRWAVDSL